MGKKRTLYFDVLNIVACFGVVAMHFNGLTHAYSSTFGWRQALFVDCLFYWAVPIFFMLSGATLMDYLDKYETNTYFRKRIRRVVIPFLAWSIIALIWKVITGQMEPPVGPRSFIELVINTQIIDIYWFFIPLMMIYLCMPVLTKLREYRSTLWYLVGIIVVANVLIPFLCSLVGIRWNPQANIPLGGGYIVYALLGYLLRDEELSKRQRSVLYVLGIAAFLLRYVGTIVLSDTSGSLNELFWGYTNLPCLLLSIAVFVFAKNAKLESLFKTQRSQNALVKVASCSFGVYLIHMILFWYGLQLTGLDGGDLLWRVVGPFVAYIICLCIVWLAKKVPGLRALF